MKALVALLVLMALGAGGWWLYRRPHSQEAEAPVDVSAEPLQEAVDPPLVETVERGGHKFTLEKFFRYQVSGEVVSATSYDLTWTNDFFDVDLGLVWGPQLADLKHRYHFFQDGRWLFWRADGPVSDADRDYVTSHSGNEHLIPAEGNANLSKAIRWIRPKDRVRVSGYLVRIKDERGKVVALSSTSRHDTGGGACEIVWVDEVQIGEALYR
jgi:hypothetical protein